MRITCWKLQNLCEIIQRYELRNILYSWIGEVNMLMSNSQSNIGF